MLLRKNNYTGGGAMASKYRVLTRTALLLTLTLLFQSIRLIVPLPPILSTFFIGSLVNSCILLAVATAGVRSAIAIAILAPIIAYFQQLLFMPIFIVPVAAGNVLYALIFSVKKRWGYWPTLSLAAIVKTICLYSSFYWLISIIAIPKSVAVGIIFIMSWPQLITAIAGGFIAFVIIQRFKFQV